ncbi:MAG TPA: hypothetical protein VLB84_09395 [Bacteroidia bacterium]|nr:hypothetical protein [Bacteroidia bacterium]
MKTHQLFFIFFFVIGLSHAKASSMLVKSETNPTSNDTSLEVKSNVVIFKLIPTPVSATTNTNTNNFSGSLKNAGKVARTSYSHSTSLENIIYKKKGI